MISVVLADDHHLVRAGIRSLIEKEPDMQVVGEAQDGREAVRLVARLRPDVLVIDISMPRLNGIQAVDQVRALKVETQSVVLSMYSDEPLVRQALRTGAKAYLLKRSVTEELLLAIRAAKRGEMYLSPPVSEYAIEAYLEDEPSESRDPYHDLTPREREVLQLIAEGHSNRGMAEMLVISIKTIEKHRANLMAKLGVKDMAGLMRVAIKNNLIFLDRE